MHNLNGLDIFIMVFLAITAVIGFSKGFIKTISTLVGIILGVVLAGRFSGPIADGLSTVLHNSIQVKIAAFASIFIVFLIISLTISALLSKLLSLLLLGWVDRLGGAVLGLLIGGLVCSAILTPITKHNFLGIEGTIQGSVLASFFVAHFNIVLPILAKGFDSVHQFFG
jgi:membrane protein required for colicin V production